LSEISAHSLTPEWTWKVTSTLYVDPVILSYDILTTLDNTLLVTPQNLSSTALLHLDLIIATPCTWYTQNYFIQATDCTKNCSSYHFQNITFLSYHSYYKKLHWLPKDCRIKYNILTLIYKALHDQAPLYIKFMLELHVYIPLGEHSDPKIIPWHFCNLDVKQWAMVTGVSLYVHLSCGILYQ